jgi:hypothetical protein
VVGAVDDPSLWPELLRDLRVEAAHLGLDWLVLSRDTRDPELPKLRKATGAREYHTRLYEVRWGAVSIWTGEWGERLLRPEGGLL